MHPAGRIPPSTQAERQYAIFWLSKKHQVCSYPKMSMKEQYQCHNVPKKPEARSVNLQTECRLVCKHSYILNHRKNSSQKKINFENK